MIKKLLTVLMLLLAHTSSTEPALTSVSKSSPNLVILPGASSVFHNSLGHLSKLTKTAPKQVEDD